MPPVAWACPICGNDDYSCEHVCLECRRYCSAGTDDEGCCDECSKGLAASYFRYWTSGSCSKVASPCPPRPEEAKPFVVRLQGQNVIPLNVLVFARDVEHAKQRVVLALKECCDRDHRGRNGIDKGKWVSVGRQHDLLDRLCKGTLDMKAAPLDIKLMPAIQWAENGGL